MNRRQARGIIKTIDEIIALSESLGVEGRFLPAIRRKKEEILETLAKKEVRIEGRRAEQERTQYELAFRSVYIEGFIEELDQED